MEFKNYFISFFFILTFSISNATEALRWSEISALHPTQSAVGELAVEDKMKFFKTLSGSEFNKYLRKNPVPVVVGPNHQLYMTDHHHLAKALQELKMDKVFISVSEDFSDLNELQFWNKMMDLNLVYLYDEKGYEIMPSDLPDQVTAMKDDIYRSLSYFVREQGGYEKSEIPFAEFTWADYFRARISLYDLNTQWQVSLKRALNMAHCSDASSLPGYVRGICGR